MADSQYQVLGRNDRGGLKQPAAENLKEAGVKLDLTLADTRLSAKSAGVLSEFNKLLPKNIVFPKASPFVILRIPLKRPGGGLVAACKCECGSSGSCGGGGGGA